MGYSSTNRPEEDMHMEIFALWFIATTLMSGTVLLGIEGMRNH